MAAWAYLKASAIRLRPGSLRRRLAALTQRHRSSGQTWPAGDFLIARTLADLEAAPDGQGGLPPSSSPNSGGWSHLFNPGV